jgi:hypothetical protein
MTKPDSNNKPEDLSPMYEESHKEWLENPRITVSLAGDDSEECDPWEWSGDQSKDHKAEDLRPMWEESHEEWLENPRILTFGQNDDWVPGKYKTPGAQVPQPAGYHRARVHEVTKPVLAFANQALKVSNPEKLPQSHIIGKRIPGIVENTPVLAQIEWHLDNHPPRPAQGYGPMEGPDFYHMGVSLYIPDSAIGFGLGVIIPMQASKPATPDVSFIDWFKHYFGNEPSEFNFGWFGSKIGHSISHFASNILKTAGHEIGHTTRSLQGIEGEVSGLIKHVPIIGGPIHSILDKTFHLAMAPSNMVVAIAEGDSRIDHAVLNSLKEQVKEFQQLAPYAEMIVSLVPGVGQGIGAALAAGVALSEGQPISGILKAGLMGAIPGGPLVQAAIETGVGIIQHVAKGDKLDFNTLSQSAAGAASTALGLPPSAKDALIAGIAITGQIAKGKPIDKALTDGAISALPVSDSAKRAMTEASSLSLELAHGGNVISAAQHARIAAITTVLPPTNPLHNNITIGLSLMQKHPEKSQSIMQAALHSGLGDTLVSMGAQHLPPEVQKGIKSGNALGSGIVYQEHKKTGLSKVTGNLVESGVQQSKHHPVFGEARKLATVKNSTHGFDYGNGLLQHQVGMFDVVTARNSLDESQKHGFDLAAATRIGTVANPKPPMISPAAHAGYAISLGMRSHNPNQKANMMHSIQQNPSASVGATLAVKEVGVDNWFVRLLRALGLHK